MQSGLREMAEDTARLQAQLSQAQGQVQAQLKTLAAMDAGLCRAVGLGMGGRGWRERAGACLHMLARAEIRVLKQCNAAGDRQLRETMGSCGKMG